MGLTGNKLLDTPFKSLAGGGSDWELSGSGTGEYYYNGMDLLILPLNVLKAGVELTYVPGGPGGLAVEQWAWGDNDSLGYNVLYVRLTGDVDPDTLSADNLKCSEPHQIMLVPSSNETIQIGMTLANNEDQTTDANIVLYTTYPPSAEVATYIEMFTIKGDDSPAERNVKLVYPQQEKLYVLTNIENLSVWVSDNNG